MPTAGFSQGLSRFQSGAQLVSVRDSAGFSQGLSRFQSGTQQVSVRGSVGFSQGLSRLQSKTHQVFKYITNNSFSPGQCSWYIWRHRRTGSWHSPGTSGSGGRSYPATEMVFLDDRLWGCYPATDVVLLDNSLWGLLPCNRGGILRRQIVGAVTLQQRCYS